MKKYPAITELCNNIVSSMPEVDFVFIRGDKYFFLLDARSSTPVLYRIRKGSLGGIILDLFQRETNYALDFQKYGSGMPSPLPLRILPRDSRLYYEWCGRFGAMVQTMRRACCSRTTRVA